MRKFAFSLLFISVIALTLLVGCQTATNSTAKETPKPTPSPSPEVSTARTGNYAEAEAHMQEMGAQDGDRFDARYFAEEYVKEHYSGWQIKGMSCQPQANATFFVDVDIYRGKSNQVVRLFVEPMFPDDGEQYWKATPLDSLLLARTAQLNNLRASQDLQDAISALQDDVRALQDRFEGGTSDESREPPTDPRN